VLRIDPRLSVDSHLVVVVNHVGDYSPTDVLDGNLDTFGTGTVHNELAVMVLHLDADHVKRVSKIGLDAVLKQGVGMSPVNR